MDTERQWAERLIAAANALRGYEEGLQAEWLAPLVAAADQGHPPVLMHGDLHALNLMMKSDGTFVVLAANR